MAGMVTKDELGYQMEWKVPDSRDLATERKDYKNMHGFGEDFLEKYKILDEKER